MKYKILFTLIFISILTFTKAQDGLLDPSFGVNGFIKADFGSHFNYNDSGIKVLAKPDGTLYSIFADNGTVVIGKMHDVAISFQGLPALGSWKLVSLVARLFFIVATLLFIISAVGYSRNALLNFFTLFVIGQLNPNRRMIT